MLTEWSWMDARSELTFPSLSVPTLPPLESTWDDPHMVVDHAAMTGATIGAMREVTIVTTTVTMIESIVHTGADLHLLTITEDTVPDLDHGPTRHVTTEQQEKKSVIV